MATLVSDLIQRTILAMRQVPGLGVQLYSEDALLECYNRMFDHAFSEMWWDAYMQWFTLTLDGTTGKPTSDLTGVQKIEDIRAIFPGTSHRRLKKYGSYMNPNALTGTFPRWYEAINETTPARVIRVLPVTATGTITIHARVKGTAIFTAGDYNKLDDALLINLMAWDYLSGDADNPGNAARFAALAQERLKQLRAERNEEAIDLDPRATEIPGSWIDPDEF